MTLDPEILKQFGWSEELIKAAKVVTEGTPVPEYESGASAEIYPPATTVTSDRIDVAASPPVGSDALILRSD